MQDANKDQPSPSLEPFGKEASDERHAEDDKKTPPKEPRENRHTDRAEFDSAEKQGENNAITTGENAVKRLSEGFLQGVGREIAKTVIDALTGKDGS